MGWGIWAALLIVFLAMGGMGSVIKLVEGRRRFLLDLKKEEARIAEAKARELEIQHKRAELEYREAVLELERFDRRHGRSTGRLRPGEISPPEPFDPE